MMAPYRCGFSVRLHSKWMAALAVLIVLSMLPLDGPLPLRISKPTTSPSAAEDSVLSEPNHYRTAPLEQSLSFRAGTGEGAPAKCPAQKGSLVCPLVHTKSSTLIPEGNASLGNWYNATPATPPPYYGGPMVNDVSEGGIILTTGAATWLFRNDTWQLLSTPVHPPNLFFESAAYDYKDGYVVLFGGFTGAYDYLDTTWIFRNGTWLDITSWSATRPSPRGNAAFAYDSSLGRVILYGGSNETSTYNDTWSFQAGNWTLLHPHGGPTLGAVSSYPFGESDGPDGVLLLCGGGSHPGCGTWILSGNNWTEQGGARQPAFGYPQGSMDYGPWYHSIFFLATNGWSYDQLWIFRNGNWSELSPAVTPPSPPGGYEMAYDSSTGYFVALISSEKTVPPIVLTWIFGAAAVVLNPSPAHNGTISTGNQTVSTPTAIELGLGTYAVAELPEPWAKFGAWSASGEVSINPISDTLANFTVLGNGTITVTYRPDPNLLLLSNSPDCGQILLGGTPYSNGTTVRYLGGTYPLSPKSCSPALQFGWWRDSGGLSVANASSANTSLRVSSNGTLTAVFVASITLRIVPASAGRVTLGGINYSSGAVAVLPAGIYALQPAPHPWAVFRSWESTYGLSIRNGTINVSLGGYLTATYGPLPLVEVGVEPTVCGPVALGGTNVSDGNVVGLPLGSTETLAAPSCTTRAEVFHRWVVRGNLTVGNATDRNTTLAGTGNGTVAAVYTPGYVVYWDVVPAGAGTILVNGTGTSATVGELLAGGNYSLDFATRNGSKGPSITWSTTGGGLVVFGAALEVRGGGTVFATVAAENGTPQGRTPGPSNLTSEVEWVVFGIGAAAVLGVGVWTIRRRRLQGHVRRPPFS